MENEKREGGGRGGREVNRLADMGTSRVQTYINHITQMNLIMNIDTRGGESTINNLTNYTFKQHF